MKLKPAAISAVLCLISTLSAIAQTPPVYVKEAFSREVGVHVGGVQVPEYKELVSREVGVFIGGDPLPAHREAISRELSVVVTTPAIPARITQLVVTNSPTGETTMLSWAGYNQWAERDVARYDIYLSTRAFTNVSAMTPYRSVPAETSAITLTGLPPWQDRFYAVVAVDAAGGSDPIVNYAAAYLVARELVSRELSVFVGAEPDPPYPQVISREVSVVVTTPQVPARITQLTASPSPTGEATTLSWAGYNEWAERDVARYDIYLSTRAFTNVTAMARYTTVPAENFSITLTNLPPWQDRFYAVVPVDGAGGSNPGVNYAAAYLIAREVVSRELSVFVGGEPEPPLRQAISREVSLVVTTPDVPAPVTGLGSGFTATMSQAAYRAIDLDWPSYNELAQRDVVRYRVYAGPAFFDNVAGMEPYAFVPAENSGAIVTGFDPLGIYHLAVVAEDALGQRNLVVRSASAQASIDRLGEVRDLAVRCETNALHFTWLPPDFAGSFLDGYRVYLGGAALPLVLDRTATNYSATHLLPAHGYPLRLTTVDVFGTESGGASLLAATLLPHPPNVVAVPFDGMLRLTWDHAEPNELVDRYAVYLAETNFTSVAGKTPTLLTRARRADLTGLVNGKTYYAAVTTINIAGGESTQASPRSGTPAPRAGSFADLAIPEVFSETAVHRGQLGAFGWRVQNVGTGPTTDATGTPVTAWVDRVFVSPDDVFGDADDVLLAEVPRVGGLTAGEAYTVNLTVPIPDLAPGTYTVFVTADAADAVYEHLDAGENVRSPEVPLRVVPALELVVDGVVVAGPTAMATNRAWVEFRTRYPNGVIRYTLDGSEPTGGTIYRDPVSVTAPVVVRAIATSEGGNLRIELDPVSVVIVYPPAIAVQPVGLAVSAGQPAQMTVVASGTEPFAYQWRRNQTLLAGATDATLTFLSVVPADAAAYSVIVSNPYGSVTSQAADLVVLTGDGPPDIVLGPANQTVALGAPVVLSVVAQGTPPLRYQWRLNGNNLGGATNFSYPIPAFQLRDGGAYTVVVWNDQGMIQGEPVLLEPDLPRLELADAFANRPVFLEVSLAGKTSNLTATDQTDEPRHAGKVGGRSLWMTWRPSQSGVATFATIGSSFDTLLAVYTGASLAGLEPVASDDDRGGFLTSRVQFNVQAGLEYHVAVDGFAGATGLVVLRWHLEAGGPAIPEITEHPRSRTAIQGEAVQFSVNSPTPGVAYQWLQNGIVLAGANQPTLALVAGPASAGGYRARVTAPNGRVAESTDAVVDVLDSPHASGTLSSDKLEDLFTDDPVAPVAPRLLHGAGWMAGLPPSQGLPGGQWTHLADATRSPNDPEPCGVLTSATRWFRLRFDAAVLPAAGAVVRLTSQGSEVPVLLAVFTNRHDLHLLACSTPAAPARAHAEVFFVASPNVDYVVLVDGLYGARGFMKLNWGLARAEELRPTPVRWVDGRLFIEWFVEAGPYEFSLGDGLDEWQTLFRTNIHHGLFQYHDPGQPTAPAKFYRLIPLP